MDNSQQIDVAAEFVKHLIAQEANLQEKEKIYAQVDNIKDEVKALDALMNGKIDLTLICKALIEKWWNISVKIT